MTLDPQSFSNTAADAVAKAAHSVVRVDGRRRQSASGIVWAEGLIVTAHHVLERDENIVVGLPDGTPVAATVLGRDPTTDLALLRVEASGLTPATWLATDTLRVGHFVWAVARPRKSVRATLGTVSALGDAWRTGSGGEIDRYLQTDVLMYPGFSGGALVDATGDIAGLNSSALGRGASVTIPAATVQRVVDSLKEHGQVRRGYLGVGVQPVRLAQNFAGELGQETGLMVMSVEGDSPAATAGLLQGDVILAVDDRPTRHLDDLQKALQSSREGQQVGLRIVRSGAQQTLQATIGVR